MVVFKSRFIQTYGDETKKPKKHPQGVVLNSRPSSKAGKLVKMSWKFEASPPCGSFRYVDRLVLGP